MTDYNYKPKTEKESYGWHSRGYLPHFDGELQTQFVTFRLADSLPQSVLTKFKQQIADEIELSRSIESYLDAGYGACWLSDHRVAELVRDALFFYNTKKYDLRAWVIMPNHVHIMISPHKGEHLPKILHSVKSFTATKANKILNRNGSFWQAESFDRYIRNLQHFQATIKYIEQNPVKAGLCERAVEWEFSSAFEVSEIE